MEYTGNTLKYGANVDTDVIIPARYLSTADPVELAKHCMEDIDPEFIHKVQKGDIVVAEANFGCGSSREHAPLALKGAGIAAVIAESFARIFYRNALNVGLPIAECPAAAAEIAAGDKITVNFKTGRIFNLSQNKEYAMMPFPDFMMELIEAGDLLTYTKNKLASEEVK